MYYEYSKGSLVVVLVLVMALALALAFNQLPVLLLRYSVNVNLATEI